MKTDDGMFCDMPRISGRKPPGCTNVANYAFFCKVEGREVHMCPPCRLEWNRRVQANPTVLSVRCPNCARMPSEASVVPIPQVPEHPVTDIFYAAIDHAMMMEGVLSPTRHKIMARLAYEAPWMCEKPDEVA